MVKADVKCEFCEGTGLVTDYSRDEDTGQWLRDGERDCACVKERKMIDEYETMTERE